MKRCGALACMGLLVCCLPASSGMASRWTSPDDGKGAAGQKVDKQAESELLAFWNRFQKAVRDRDKKAVASMTHFPLEMPYGVPKIQTKEAFVTGYKKVFDEKTRKCFLREKPDIEKPKARSFKIWCSAGMMYRFDKLKEGFRLVDVDNVNE